MKPVRICISSPKGGIGKTLISVHLSWFLSLKNVKTALIDFGSTLTATKYVNRKAFNEMRKNSKESGVTRLDKNLVIASCEDWDKLPKYDKEKESLFSNPQSPPLTLENGKELETCRVFIYDTDHFISSLVYFQDNFDVIFLVIDPGDFNSLDNLTDFWIMLKNARDLEKSKKRIFIVANRTKNSNLALKKIKDWLKIRCDELGIESSKIRQYQNSIEESFVYQFTIPKFLKAKDSFISSQPVWAVNKDLKDPFIQFYKFLKNGKVL